MASRMDKTEETDGASNTNVSSEDISMSLTRNGESATQLSLKSYCYTWTINDFFKCFEFSPKEHGLCFNFYSAPFMFVNTEWYWRLTVKKGFSDTELTVVLMSKSNIARNFSMKSEVSIVDDDGKVHYCYHKIIVGNGGMKEYSYPSLELRGTDNFSPNKLIVRSEFSALISEICEDTESSFSNRDLQ